MIISWIIYAAVLLLLFVFSVLYVDSLAVVMMCACILLPFILGALLFVGSRKISVSLAFSEKSGGRGEASAYNIIIEKSNGLPVYCIILLKAENMLTGEVTANSFKGLIYGKRKTLSGKLKGEHCGNITVSAERAQTFDYFRLFHRKIKTNAKDSLLLFPKLWDIDGALVTMPALDEEGDVYSKIQSGNDPSEIFGIREFRQEDDPRRIHWKLSVKTDGYFVKEYGQPMLNSIMLLLEKDKTAPDLQDGLLDLLLSLSNFLLEQGVSHIICIEDGDGTLNFCKITKGEELYSAVSGILNMPFKNSKGYQPALTGYLNASDNRHTHLIYLTADRKAAENPLLKEQLVPVTAMVAVEKSAKNIWDENNIRCMFVKVKDISNSLAGLEL